MYILYWWCVRGQSPAYYFGLDYENDPVESTIQGMPEEKPQVTSNKFDT